MVDALRRARRLLTSDGLVVDFHPTASNETLEVGDRVTGFVDAGAALRRHSAASHALEAAVLEGLFSDRKSTRLNSSHRCISYAVFCLKKKKKTTSKHDKPSYTQKRSTTGSAAGR